MRNVLETYQNYQSIHQEKIIQTDEPVDESETNLKNPEGMDLNCVRNLEAKTRETQTSTEYQCFSIFCVKKIVNVKS